MHPVHLGFRTIRFSLRGMNYATVLSAIMVAVVILCFAGRALYSQCTSYTSGACSWVSNSFIPCTDTTTCFTIPSSFSIGCADSIRLCTLYKNSSPPTTWAVCSTIWGQNQACNSTPQPCGTTLFYMPDTCTGINLCDYPYNTADCPPPYDPCPERGPLTWCESSTTQGLCQ
jgi:hypothetical protein